MAQSGAMRTVLLALVLAACQAPHRTARPEIADDRKPPPPPKKKKSVNAPQVLAWTSGSWAEVGIGFDQFDGVDVHRHAWNPGGVASQDIVRGGERVRWLIRTNVDETLEGFRLDHQDWKLTPTTISVCGQRAPGLVATHASQDITCVMTATGNHPAHIPPRRAVAVQYATRAGVPVVASFEIESADIETWLDTEDRFFAGLRCP